nr:hypothetical protein [Pseudolysinimonas kribbensis]
MAAAMQQLGHEGGSPALSLSTVSTAIGRVRWASTTGNPDATSSRTADESSVAAVTMMPSTRCRSSDSIAVASPSAPPLAAFCSSIRPPRAPSAAPSASRNSG